MRTNSPLKWHCFAGAGQWNKENEQKGGLPRIIVDKASRKPYKSGSGSHGPIERINIRSGDKLVNLRDQSEVVRALSDFKLSRVYYREEDDGARSTIDDILKKS